MTVCIVVINIIILKLSPKKNTKNTIINTINMIR